MKRLSWIAGSLLDVVYPEKCTLCGAMRGEAPWAPRGSRVTGLRFWDGAHLCRACAAGLGHGQISGRVGTGSEDGLTAVAASHTNSDLVKLVGQFKYHGVRGLAWPLVCMLHDPLAAALDGLGAVDALVPVALHARRRRVRGFNQAEILARLLTSGSDLIVLSDALVRHRNTGQQAKITSCLGRRENLAASFKARPPSAYQGRWPGGTARIGLVDDLITSGWTAVSAAAQLRAVGWDVRWVLALGLAVGGKKQGRRVDTWEAGF